MNPDLGSGTGISYDAQLTLVMIQVDASRKTADQQVLLDKSAISPKTVSNGENTLPRIYKIKNSRDAKLAILKELRKGNPSFKRTERRKKLQTVLFQT